MVLYLRVPHGIVRDIVREDGLVGSVNRDSPIVGVMNRAATDVLLVAQVALCEG